MRTRQLLTALLVMLTLGLLSTTASAQSTTDPDTVCAGATGVSYSVTNTTGSTYHWIIAGGTQASGGNTNSITVDWSSTSGTDVLQVVEENENGCFGDTIALNVYRMPLPTATIAGDDTVCFNTASSFTVTFTGVGPWDFTWSDGTTPTTESNISANPYTVNIPATNPGSTTTVSYTVTNVSNFFGCTGSASGTATITTIPKPTTSSIFH